MTIFFQGKKLITSLIQVKKPDKIRCIKKSQAWPAENMSLFITFLFTAIVAHEMPKKEQLFCLLTFYHYIFPWIIFHSHIHQSLSPSFKKSLSLSSSQVFITSSHCVCCLIWREFWCLTSSVQPCLQCFLQYGQRTILLVHLNWRSSSMNFQTCPRSRVLKQ